MTQKDEDRREREPGDDTKSATGLRGWFWLVLLLGVLLWITARPGAGRAIPYSEFKDKLAAGEVKSCVVATDHVRGVLQPKDESGRATPFETVRVDDPDLVEELEAAGVAYSGVSSGVLSTLLWWLLPLGLMLVFWIWLFRRMGGAGASGAALSFGKSRAKLVAQKDTGVDFADVAGCDEAKQELTEVVDFLKNPARYVALGAQIPKGVMLLGPPGTGKTLLAKAVAGEAGVPFFSISGSDFVEMFVGVGAARVRDLFEQAKKRAPCIVFIDEIDAVGRTRGVHIGSVNDEREQTLNQLLVELDGFEPNSGVILLAATNRPDVLDRALLRPGRFDRQVVLDTPDLEGRVAILRVHARDKPLADDVDLSEVARGTPGFSGADLANALNEAALLAARRKGRRITQEDVEQAIEKLVAGPERKSHRLLDPEKRRVAYHESGHALVAFHSEHADPVHKISIVPRGRAALGWTMQLPEQDQALLTCEELEAKLSGLLGGRAAEELVFDSVSTGAANDLERATALARQMVCLWGLGEATGLMHCAHDPAGSLGGGAPQIVRDCSETTAREIDLEVRRLLDRAYDRATGVLITHRSQLERVSRALLEQETLDAAALHELVSASHATNGEEARGSPPATPEAQRCP